MQTIGKILAGASAILFVITGVLGILLFNIERKAFSAESYKRAFEKQNLYEKMPVVLASAFSTSILGSENADSLLSTMLTEGGAFSISTFLPPEELKVLTDNTLDSIFGYLNGESDSAAIPLASFKTHLSSPAGVEAVLNVLRAQPDCTVEQLLQITFGALTGSGFIFCNPPPEALALVTPLVQAQLQFTAAALPDQITLISAAQSGTGNDPRIRLNRIRTAMKVTLLMPLMFLVALTVFAVRSLTDWLKWWGGPFLVTGGVSYVLSILGVPITGLIIQAVLENQISGMIFPALVTTLRETTNAVARQILGPVALQGLILTIIGFGMILGAFFLTRRGQLFEGLSL